MDKFEKVIELHRLLSNARYALPLAEVCEKLGNCSNATFYRLKGYLKNVLGAPLIFDKKYNGYRYDTASGATFELPGLWLSARETEALLGFHDAITSLQSGFFNELFAPVKQHLSGFMKKQNLRGAGRESPVRIIAQQSRSVDDAVFRTCANAVIAKKTITIHHDKPDGTSGGTRTVSPFSLIRYRDNWYLDAWCHLRGELRTFSLDRINTVLPSTERFHPVVKRDRESFYADAYGIFNGPAKYTAHLRFTGIAATQVPRELWHPRQKGEYTLKGDYLLTLPYSDDRELVMDILKWGPNAEVILPQELRSKVKSLLGETMQKYT